MVCTVIRDRLWALDFSCMFTDEGYATINYHTLKSHDLRGVILSLPLSPLVILQDFPLAVHQCPFSTQECTPGWKIALRERRVFPISTTQSSSQCLYVTAYGSSGQNVSHYTLSYFSPLTAKEADQILVVIATF